MQKLMIIFTETPFLWLQKKTMGHTDASEAATWFLSYLCELGYIDNDDDVFNYVMGHVAQPFLGLEVGTEVYIVASRKNCRRYNVYHRPGRKEVEEEVEDVDEEEELDEEEMSWHDPDCDVWWENPETDMFTFEVGDMRKILKVV